ncbi:MAG: hypothetical protein HY747_08855 [Elusimicrobia bacterium]|nr:hypothetical protein [Elusimicrobiota bacterium]
MPPLGRAGADKGGGQCPKIEKNNQGAFHIYDESCKLTSVIVPVKNEKAKDAVDANKGKAAAGMPGPGGPAPCAPPSASVVHDTAGASEAIFNDYGLLAFQSYDASGGGAMLGYLMMWNGRNLYWDGDIETGERPFTLTIINPGWIVTHPFVVKAGESVSINYDNGQIMNIVFPVSVSVNINAGVMLFVSREGKLYWDAELTQPLDPNSGC